VVVSVHGIMSDNSNMSKTMNHIKKEIGSDSIHYTKISYGYTLATLNLIPWVRDLIRDYISARISNISNKYRNAKIILLAHSNGTWGTARGIERWYNVSSMRIDMLILVGCVLKRKFDWSDFPEIKVLNIIATRDWVSMVSKWVYGMGQAGIYGFTGKCPNLKQVRLQMGHTGFVVKAKKIIVDNIREFIND